MSAHAELDRRLRGIISQMEQTALAAKSWSERAYNDAALYDRGRAEAWSLAARMVRNALNVRTGEGEQVDPWQS